MQDSRVTIEVPQVTFGTERDGKLGRWNGILAKSIIKNEHILCVLHNAQFWESDHYVPYFFINQTQMNFELQQALMHVKMSKS